MGLQLFIIFYISTEIQQHNGMDYYCLKYSRWGCVTNVTLTRDIGDTTSPYYILSTNFIVLNLLVKYSIFRTFV